MATIYVALGTNIDPENNIKAAATILRENHPTIRFSSVYRSAPLHHEDQDDFLNAVATFSAELSADATYDFLHKIEKKLRKRPLFRFGPRTIDLDLLLHGNDIVESSSLTIPHPRMHERRFVLEPMLELIPEDAKGYEHSDLGEINWGKP
jgi:2-amino-4-hydroxy-6-hydroxymethyldihydropteridine diphosphokinase